MQTPETTSTTLVPIHVGQSVPPPAEERQEAEPSKQDGGQLGDAGLRSPSIDWRRHGLEPRWLGMETSDCAAAIDPGIFHDRGAQELDRFLAGASSRNEVALVVATIGSEVYGPRDPFAAADSSILMPGLVGMIRGRRLPSGARASLVSDAPAADRDLGMRLLNRPPDAPWWGLSLSGTEALPGAGGPAMRYEPGGQLEPILVDGMGDPVVAAWSSDSGDQRWYVIPNATEWKGVLDWLVQHALRAHVPASLRRARSPHALDPALQTEAEISARQALDALDANHLQERHRLEEALKQATDGASKVRDGLLYGTGAELVEAVASVLRDAGFVAVDLDAELGDTASADLLVTYGQEHRLVEVKSAGGRAGEALVGHLERHLATWPHLRPHVPVNGGVLVVNHQHRLEPHEREADVYSRAEFVAALTVPVLPTRQLFEWWRASDWAAIRGGVLGHTPRSTEPVPTTQSLQPPPSEPRPRAGRSRWWNRRRPSTD